MKKQDKEMVLEECEMEGFEYTFIYRKDFEQIKDEKFHTLRLNYIKAQKELAKYIGYENS